MNIRNSRPNHASGKSENTPLAAQLQEWARRRVLPAGREWLEQIVNGFADSREQEEPMELDTVPLGRVAARPVLSGAAHIRTRWRQAEGSRRPLCIGGLAFVLAFALTGGLQTLLPHVGPLLFLIAVMVSAIMGGMRAGVFTTSLTALFGLAILYFTPSLRADPATGLLRLIAFVLLDLGACAFSDSLYLSRQQAETAQKQAEILARRSLFLARASALLDSSHDPVTLSLQVTRAIVPAFAECAIVDLLDAQQTLRRVAAMHQNPEKEALLEELAFRFPLDAQGNHPLAGALRTGKAELIESVDESLLTAISTDADYLELARRFGTRSLLCAPLVARNRTFGTLTLIATSCEHGYTRADLVVAKDLALRIALALDNLRLYHEAQQEIAERARMEQQIRDYSLHLEQQRLQLEEANIRLTLQVSTDGLTGLNNHLAFQETLAKEVQRATRYGSPLSLLLLDVDNFKQYNDTYGHPAGDQVLRNVAEVLKTGARETDFAARYGGEEFAVVLPNTSAAEAVEVAERLRQAIEALRGLERIVTASFGVATLGERITTSPELISWSDKALYASKHAGRNRVTHAERLPSSGLDLEMAFDATAEAVVAIPNSVGYNVLNAKRS